MLTHRSYFLFFRYFSFVLVVLRQEPSKVEIYALEYALGSINIREQTNCKIAAHHDIQQITKPRRQELYLPNQAKYPKAP